MESNVNKMVCLVIAFFLLLSMATIPLQSNGGEQKTQETKSLPTLIEIGKGTCYPCKMMMPILNELKKEHAGALNVKFVDVRYDRRSLEQRSRLLSDAGQYRRPPLSKNHRVSY